MANQPILSRRQLLGLAAAAGVEATTRLVGDAAPGQVGTAGRETLAAAVTAPAQLLLARGDDGLLVTVSFANLDVVAGSRGTPRLTLHDATMPGYVVLGLRAQSIFERAVFDDGVNPAPPPDRPVDAAAAGPSRIVLRIPAGSPARDYTLANLLDLPSYTLAISTVARDGSGASQPSAGPADLETAIEAPYRLVLSPTAVATFTAMATPVARNGRTELWHARAVPRRPDGHADQTPGPVPVRAIWSPDLATPPPPAPDWTTVDADVAMTAEQRIKLVHATTTSDDQGTAAPAGADLLLVSPMGTSLDVTGAWPLRPDVVAWRHRSYLGRDNYVRVEEPGFLFPFGFRAVKVSITERVLGGGEAYLRKQIFVAVREPVLTYPIAGQPNVGRDAPFAAAEVSPAVSPPLAATPEPIGAGFWVQLGGGDLLPYQLKLTGQDGGVVTAHLPLVFVPAGTTTAQSVSDPAYARADMQAIIDAYLQQSMVERRTMHLDGQRLAFVPPHGTGREDPALPTYDLVVGAERTADGGEAAMFTARRLNGFPTMVSAQVHLEIVDAVGRAGATVHAKPHGATPHATPTLTGIALNTTYTASGFAAPNPGELWADVPTPPMLSVPKQLGAGLTAPQISVKSLSRALGPVADPTGVTTGKFDPTAYFPADLNLLGGLPLGKVIALQDGITDFRGPAGDTAPKVVVVRTPQAVDTTITWQPVLKSDTDDHSGLFEPAASGPDQRLTLRAVLHTDLGSGATTTTITGEMRNFTLFFVGRGKLGFIRQQVKRLRFESQNGAKPVVDIQLGPTTFTGDLGFLADLQRYLPALPGGVRIDANPSGVTAALDIAIPSVGVGVLVIQNLSIGVALDLPFTGRQASLGFAFATREHPFQLTVSALGGGGFLGIGLGTQGVQMIEGSLEFGAAVAIDLVVASGSVSIMAGIYFKYAQKLDASGAAADPPGNTLVITGFVRAVGKLSVLGLIHASVEFYLGLTYEKTTGEQGKVQGDAKLTIRVDVLMFSKSVSVSMHKEFDAGADPSFGQQISAADWSTYCAAFA